MKEGARGRDFTMCGVDPNVGAQLERQRLITVPL